MIKTIPPVMFSAYSMSSYASVYTRAWTQGLPSFPVIGVDVTAVVVAGALLGVNLRTLLLVAEPEIGSLRDELGLEESGELNPCHLYRSILAVVVVAQGDPGVLGSVARPLSHTSARVTRAFFFPHFLLSSSPTFTFVLLHYFRRSTGACGKAVMCAAAADQAGNDGLEGGIREKPLGERQLDLSSVTARLRGCSCVVLFSDSQSRFDSFKVCPGVGTVVTTVVACGVPKWWHSFDYSWYMYPVWVMVLWWYIVYQSVLVLSWNCVFWRLYGVTFHSMCFTLLRIWISNSPQMKSLSGFAFYFSETRKL
ncbi:hypothetical protein Taro_047822, partial [Colocasia esculenta]|nr:hypothetical protein [Colocasia esculenta]